MNNECKSSLSQGIFNQKICFSLLDDIIDSSGVNGARKVLMYDARKWVHNTGVFPPGHEALEVYLNRADVRKAIHADTSNHKYVECADPPFLALTHQVYIFIYIYI
jgi:hypothetical protein